MSKHIVVLIADVKYPSSNHSYLSANSYVIEKGTAKPLSDAIDDFKAHIETDSFKILNMLAYVVPDEQCKACIEPEDAASEQTADRSADA